MKNRRARRSLLARLAIPWIILTQLVIESPLQSSSAHPDPASHAQSDLETTQTPTSDASRRAAVPVAIHIPEGGVNGLVETRGIVDGELSAPSGPWIVAWYEQTARPGESGNVVMSGHVDYWDVGPAVFASLGLLETGAKIEVTDAAGSRFVYVVEWVRGYSVADLTIDDLREIVGPSESPSLTLITCGGEYDRRRGEYRQRLVVRATRGER